MSDIKAAAQGKQEPAADPERIAQLVAHRACCGVEHDPQQGKLHGYCVVCGVPWPCEYAGKPPATPDALLAAELRGMEWAAEMCDRIGVDWRDAGDMTKFYATNYLVEAIRAEIKRREGK